MKTLRSTFALLAIPCLTLACSSTDGEGTVTVTAYGESFIEEGIPASEMSDGWEIEFDHFDVTIEDVKLGGEELSDIESVDLSKNSSGEGHELGTLLVSEGDHTESSFSITHVDVEGQATKGDVTKTFHWIFDQPTTYGECETTTSVDDGGSSTFQITVHADHLFYDSLVAEEPALLFGPLAAADEDDDGEITEEELSSTDIGAYDPGSEDGIEDLWAFLNGQAKTLGHVDGEGHCHVESD
jgi:hypothetical protein